MGQVATRLARPFRNFNVDNRAAKVLEKRQKVAQGSPYYPTTSERLSRFRQEHPEFLEAQQKRDEKLHEHLKKVYVESVGDPVQFGAATKAFPINRKPPPDTDMGALEATDVSEGRASLKSVFGFLNQFRSDPQTVTATKIARDYNLDEKEVENVLHHFKIFYLHIPEEMYKENKDMKKIIAEQIKSSSIMKPFLLEKENKEAEKPPSSLSPTKA